MALLGAMRAIYRAIDRGVLSRLSPDTQRAVKRPVLYVGQKIAPGVFGTVRVEDMVRRPERTPAGARDPIPDWARREMDAIARDIDPTFDTSAYASGNTDIYVVPTLDGAAGKAYRELRAQLPDRVDTLLIVPWLKPGGADLGVLHYVRGLMQAFGHTVVVLSTENESSSWKGRLPPGALFIEAGAAIAGLNAARSEPEAVLARLIVQARPRRVHVVGSRLGWETYVRHGLALRQGSDLFASLFCDDYDEAGRRVGWAVRYLPGAYRHLRAVITDNTRSPVEWVRLLGVPSELFHVVRFPAPAGKHTDATEQVPQRRILWAGRLDRQKRPEVLAAHARAMPDFEFDVYGSQVVPGHAGDIAQLRALANVRMRGAFNGLQSIADPAYLAMVYTTGWDGMPNILLEAAAAGIPIVAPDVGGIGDLLDRDDLVRHADDIDGYVRRLREMVEYPAARRALLARQRIAVGHRNARQFERDLGAVPDYTRESEKGTA